MESGLTNHFVRNIKLMLNSVGPKEGLENLAHIEISSCQTGPGYVISYSYKTAAKRLGPEQNNKQITFRRKSEKKGFSSELLTVFDILSIIESAEQAVKKIEEEGYKNTLSADYGLLEQ